MEDEIGDNKFEFPFAVVRRRAPPLSETPVVKKDSIHDYIIAERNLFHVIQISCENLEEGGWTTETLENGVNTDIQETARICNNCLSIIGVLPK